MKTEEIIILIKLFQEQGKAHKILDQVYNKLEGLCEMDESDILLDIKEMIFEARECLETLGL